MPTAFLHIGQHKTGTTGFQSFMKTNRNWLWSHGFYVPDTGCSDQGAHHQMVLALSGLIDNQHLRNLPQALSSEITQNRHPNLLISSESMTRYFKFSELEHKICSFFSDLGYTIVPIVILRDLVPLRKSIYIQTTKNIRNHRSFESFLQNIAKKQLSSSTHPKKQSILRYLKQQKQNPIVIPYNTSTRQQGIARTIMNGLGITDHVPPEARLNHSVSDAQIYASRWLGKYIEKTGEPLSALHRPILQSRMANFFAEEFSSTDSYNPLTPESVDFIRQQQNQKLLNYVAQNYWGHSWEEAFQHDSPYIMESNDWMENPKKCPPPETLGHIQTEVLGIWNDVQAEFPFNQKQNIGNLITRELGNLTKN